MGIPRFFQFIRQTFPSCVDYKTIHENLDFDIDNFYIDANGIIHNSVRQILFSKPKQEKRLARIQNRSYLTLKEKHQKIFEHITDTIYKITQFANPKQLLFIAIDGSAPMAKQSQQRQRRFRSAMEINKNEFKEFDKNSITPGTYFMQQLSFYIEYYIRRKMQDDEYWRSLDIVFSNSNEPGEGEHKIINYIRGLPNKKDISHCMYGLDADLFMLSLSTHCEKFWLMREDVFSNDMLLHFHIGNIGKLRYLMNELWNSKNKKQVDRLINDFIFLCFLIGNDFLHHTPMCHDLCWSIRTLMDCRQELFEETNEYITTTNGKSYHISKLKKYLFVLKKYEPYAIADLRHNNTFEYPAVNTSLIENNNKVDLDKFRELYYKKANIKDKEKYLKDYLEGLEWVNYYYHSEPNNWKWVFPYLYTPLITDLALFLESKPKLNRLSKKHTDKIEPYEQLLCVLPLKSKYNIPKGLHEIIFDDTIKQYYPEEFAIDIEGKAKEWQGVALLPFLDYSILHTKYLDDKYTDIRNQKRNQFNTKKLYKFNQDIKYNYKSSYGYISPCNIKTIEIQN